MMRRDARKLFEKLNKREYQYREFEDSFPDLEPWPIFEALLRDERVVGTEAMPSTTRNHHAGRAATADTAGAGAGAAIHPTPIFARYREEPKPDPQAVIVPKVDLRDFFGRMAENG